MIKKTFLFGSFLLIASTIACVSLAADTDGADSSATDPAVRMKSWEQHVKLERIVDFQGCRSGCRLVPEFREARSRAFGRSRSGNRPSTAGAGSGNLWKSVNNGTTWKPVFESESTFSVSVVTVSDDDPNLVWVGTGEPHMARSSFAGTGFSSRPTRARHMAAHGAQPTRTTSARVLIDPKDIECRVRRCPRAPVFLQQAARRVQDHRRRRDLEEESFISLRRLVSWKSPSTRPTTKTLYAVAWERDRKAWNNVIAGPGSGIYKSTDAGETWKLLTKGLPTGEKVGRMGIADRALQSECSLPHLRPPRRGGRSLSIRQQGRKLAEDP